MIEKIDDRIPHGAGKGALLDYPAVRTPWEKLISLHDSHHFIKRHDAIITANFLQVLRILVPDYEERASVMCDNAYALMNTVYQGPYGPMGMEQHCIHPFMRGNFIGSLTGDSGDEIGLMCGRVTDFGTYRVEKELDTCPMDIIGSELCRCTTASLQGVSDAQAAYQPGPRLEYHMVEAKGCGDRHCRIVAECREKYPMPPHKNWELFGPIATADLIKYTKEEDTLTEPQFFRKECNYTYCTGTCHERTVTESYMANAPATTLGIYVLPVIDQLIREGKLDDHFVNHVIRCVFEASGKTAFGDFYAEKGLRDWIGVPDSIHDGRVLGAYIEILCQMMKIEYNIEAFNKDEVIYQINRAGFARYTSKLIDAYLAFWYGMSKTLIGAAWSLWEDAGDSSSEVLRIKIAKKIDKFC